MPDHTRLVEPQAVAVRFCAAMSEDVSTLAALMDDDYVRYGIETGWSPMTKAKYVKMAENFKQPFPDARWDIQDLVVGGNQVAVDLIESGTFTRPWTVRDVTIEPNGSRYEMRGAVFFTVNGKGLISRYTYIHTGSFTDHYADVLSEDFYIAYAEEFLA